jgi:ATP-binding cassette subfamily C (CFTR/MRP) protein 1
VLWSSKADLRPRTSIAAAVLGFLSSLISCFLSHLEHIHSVRPSALLNSYLLYSILVDFARTRTMWLLKADHEIAILYTVVAAWKVVLLISEETSKKEILKPEYAAYPPEVTSGVTSRALFLWINPLFMNGFKNLLSLSDLFVIDKSLGSGALLRQRQSATALRKLFSITNVTLLVTNENLQLPLGRRPQGFLASWSKTFYGHFWP